MKLHTETTGNGPDLFLIHGWGLNGAIWSGVCAALEADYRVTTVDLPGHGHSPGGHFDLDTAAAALLDAAPPQASWIAWSLGGVLALRAARRAPQRMASLILVASSPRFVQAPDWPHAFAVDMLAQFHAALELDYRTSINRFLALQVRGSEASSETLRALRQQLFAHGEPDPAALAAGLVILRDADLRTELAELQTPLRFIMGGRDTLMPPAAAEACATTLTPAQVQCIPGAGHAPFLSHPAAFLAALRKFLQDNSAPKAHHHAP